MIPGRDDPNVIDREVRALELRRAGLSYKQIAEEIGWAAESSAARAVERALQRTLKEPADAVRQIEASRLDEYLSRLMPAIQRGEPRAIEVALKVSERRSRLLGLDAPSRQETQVEVLDGSAIEQEVLRLARMLDDQGAPDQEPADD